MWIRRYEKGTQRKSAARWKGLKGAVFGGLFRGVVEGNKVSNSANKKCGGRKRRARNIIKTHCPQFVIGGSGSFSGEGACLPRNLSRAMKGWGFKSGRKVVSDGTAVFARHILITQVGNWFVRGLRWEAAGMDSSRGRKMTSLSGHVAIFIFARSIASAATLPRVL